MRRASCLAQALAAALRCALMACMTRRPSAHSSPAHVLERRTHPSERLAAGTQSFARKQDTLCSATPLMGGGVYELASTSQTARNLACASFCCSRSPCCAAPHIECEGIGCATLPCSSPFGVACLGSHWHWRHGSQVMVVLGAHTLCTGRMAPLCRGATACVL